MICKHCSNNVPSDSEYCPFCGNNIEKSIVKTTSVSEIDKGYTYLEMKEWQKAKEIFDFAIVNNDNKSRAYIGRLLVKLKLTDLESLSKLNKKLTTFDDFKLAVKYADEDYKTDLKKCYLSVEQNYQRKSKTKKKFIISTISCISAILILVLSYFVFIPLGRYSYYDKLLSDGNIEKAIKSYSNSNWFEYDEKVKELFYNTGVLLVENKDYKNAELCFNSTSNLKDSKKYSTYCKAQILLANNDLESYCYFNKCRNFLDSNTILETNEYLVLINKLQGTWEHKFSNGSIYMYIDNISCDFLSYDCTLKLSDDKICIDNNDELAVIEFINDKTFLYYNDQWEKK